MILAAQMSELRSRFTPLPAKLHIIFCLLATVIFLVHYFRRKKVSSLIWILICDSTVILQFYSDRRTAIAVGICEIVLFAVLFKVWFVEYRERKKAAEEEKKKTPDEPSTPEQDELKDIEKLVKTERSKLADNSDDIIGNAFEDDRP